MCGAASSLLSQEISLRMLSIYERHCVKEPEPVFCFQPLKQVSKGFMFKLLPKALQNKADIHWSPQNRRHPVPSRRWTNHLKGCCHQNRG